MQGSIILLKEKGGKNRKEKGEERKWKKQGGGDGSKKLVKKFRLWHTLEIYSGEQNLTQNFKGGK